MVSDLPYIQPEKDLFLNVGMVVLIISELAQTKRGKKVLSLEKLQIFYFLVTHPVLLNKVLGGAGKQLIVMREEEYYTVDTLAVNLDDIFDRQKIKTIVKFLSYKNWLSFSYDKKHGFLVELSEEGIRQSEGLVGGHFIRARRYSDQLRSLQSESSSKLNGYINQAFKREL